MPTCKELNYRTLRRCIRSIRVTTMVMMGSMLDHSGYVAEGTGENIFVIREGKVKTPPVVNILAGITRRTALIF